MTKFWIGLIFLFTLVSYQNCSDTFDASRLSGSKSSGSNSEQGSGEQVFPFDYSSLRLDVENFSVLQGDSVGARVFNYGKNLDLRFFLQCPESGGELQMENFSCEEQFQCARASCGDGIGTARVRLEAIEAGTRKLNLTSNPISILTRTKQIVDNLSISIPQQVNLNQSFQVAINPGPQILGDGNYSVEWTLPSGCRLVSGTLTSTNILVNCSQEGAKLLQVKASSQSYQGSKTVNFFAGNPKLDFSILVPDELRVGEGKYAISLLNIDSSKGINSFRWRVSDPKCILDYASTPGVVNYLRCEGRPSTGALTVFAEIDDDIYYGNSQTNSQVLKGILTISIVDARDVERGKSFTFNSSVTHKGKSFAVTNLNFKWKVCDRSEATYTGKTMTNSVTCNTFTDTATATLEVSNGDYMGVAAPKSFKVFQYKYIYQYNTVASVITSCNLSTIQDKLKTCSETSLGQVVQCCEEIAQDGFDIRKTGSQAPKGGFYCVTGSKYTCSKATK